MEPKIQVEQTKVYCERHGLWTSIFWLLSFKSRCVHLDQVGLALAQGDEIVPKAQFQRVAQSGATDHFNLCVGHETKIQQALPDSAARPVPQDAAPAAVANLGQNLRRARPGFCLFGACLVSGASMHRMHLNISEHIALT
jgi:hypothetical protein